MVPKLPAGFLSKPEALEKHQKPERTFQRRLAKALQTQNASFLEHFFLVTSDGKIRKGTGVEQGDVNRLKTDGLYPVWYVEEEWFAKDYDMKSQKKHSSANTESISQAFLPPQDRSTLDRTAMVTEIESLSRELVREREHNATITKQLTIKDEQIQAANMIVIESNQREKEYSRLLQDLAGRIPSLDSSRVAKETSPTVRVEVQPSQQAHSIDADVIDSEPKRSKANKPKSSSTAQTRIKKKSMSSKRSKRPKKAKWYEVPTVRRIFSR